MLKKLFTYFILILFFQLALNPMLSYAASADTEQEGDEDEDEEEEEEEETEDESETEEEGEEIEEEEIPAQPQVPEQPQDIQNPLTSRTPNEDMIITSKVYDKKNIVFKKRYWREIDFGTLPNSGYFFREHEIMIYILKGIESGKVKAYKSYDKKEQMTAEQFREHRV